MIRRITGLILVSLLLLGCAACSSTPEAASTAPSAGAQVTEAPEETSAPSSEETASAADSMSADQGRVYWFLEGNSDSMERDLEKVARLYESTTGVPVEVRVASPDLYEAELTNEMNRSEPPTIFDINSGYEVDVWGSHTLDLTDTDIAKEIDSTSYNMYDSDQKLVALGYAIDCFGIIVNPRLVARAGYNADDIVDFPSLQRVVQDIHVRRSDLGFDAFTSLDLATSSDVYTAHLANIDYYYEQGLTRWYSTPPTITGEYLENYRNLYDLARLNCIDGEGADEEDPLEQFESESAAFCYGGSWYWSELQDDVPDATMIPYYCGVSGDKLAGLNGDAQNHWAVNADVSETDQQTALDFMLWCVTDAEASRMLVDTLGSMPYTHAQPSNNPFLAAANRFSKEGRYTMNWAFLCQPNPAAYRTELRAALQAYNENPNDTTWEAFRKAFVEDWAQEYLIAYPNANRTEAAVAEVTTPEASEAAASDAPAEEQQAS